MLAKIQKWGNSQGLRLTKNLLADAKLGVGNEFSPFMSLFPKTLWLKGYIMVEQVKSVDFRGNS
jgi:hypothetical protein